MGGEVDTSQRLGRKRRGRRSRNASARGPRMRSPLPRLAARTRTSLQKPPRIPSFGGLRQLVQMAKWNLEGPQRQVPRAVPHCLRPHLGRAARWSAPSTLERAQHRGAWIGFSTCRGKATPRRRTSMDRRRSDSCSIVRPFPWCCRYCRCAQVGAALACSGWVAAGCCGDAFGSIVNEALGIGDSWQERRGQPDTE